MTLNHSFSVDLATKYDVEMAILIHHFQYWIRHNKRLGKNNHNGHTWSYQTLRDIEGYFPYLSKFQIQKIINKLIDQDILIKGNYNNSTYDRTLWYAFKDEALFGIDTVKNMPNDEDKRCISGKPEMEKLESRNGFHGNQKPIPDTKTNTRKEDILEEKESASISEKDIKSRETNITNIITPDKKAGAAPLISLSFISFGEFVKITQKQYDLLVKEHSKSYIDQIIEEVNLWYPNRGAGRKWRDWNAGIKSWIRRKKEQQRGNNPKFNNAITQTSQEEIDLRNEKTDIIIKKLAAELREKNVRMVNRGTHVIINNDEIYYKDPKFIELLTSSLAKFGIRLSPKKE